ncbi:HAMP domain-containing histidine kinase [Patescibacteria group bacterium]|nr:HAMP domain-containing histidine kinase [Patescibacteria group bacterium]
MSALAERVVESMQKKYMDKDVIVHKHIAPHVFVATHQGAAESVISNVLDNAYKYTKE